MDVQKTITDSMPWLRQHGSYIIFGVLGALAVMLPLVLPDQRLVWVMTLIALYVIMAVGLNITVGYCGQLDLGFIAFVGIGAYTSAILTTKIGLNFFFALPVAVALSIAIAMTIGYPTLRLKGDYLAIVTLGFAEVMRLVFTNWTSVTGGNFGIADIPTPTVPFTEIAFTVSDRRYLLHPYYYLVLVFVVLAIIFVHRLEASHIGRAWKAIRDDELAASAMGISLQRYKLAAYATGAAFGGLAGAFQAPFLRVIEPRSYVFLESCLVLCMVVIGGIGSLPGVVLGAVLMSVLPELLRALPDFVPALGAYDFYEYRNLLFGAMMVLVIVMRPQGLLGKRG